MAWNDTSEGQHVNTIFDYLRDAYQNVLPSHLQTLTQLASRPIRG